jgi:methanogenic corrinoid protein MtbC1
MSRFTTMGTTVRPIAFDAELLEELERRLQASGEDLSAFVNAAVARDLQGEQPLLRVVRELDFPVLAEAYAAALLAREGHRARAIIADAAADGADVIDLYASVLRPALERIGHAWALDEASVAQEHYASEVSAQVIAELAAGRRLPSADGRLAIVTCSPEEQHLLGSRIVADVLERAGWEVMRLGAATPPGDLAELADAERPDLVALSTSTAGRLPGLEDVLSRLAGLDPRPLLVVGGPLYTREVTAAALGWGADVVTSDLRDLLAQLRERFAPSDAR